jgi:DMSO/TMAO reductase YedYZ molybdopterin-dependent catalytic subunit
VRRRPFLRVLGQLALCCGPLLLWGRNSWAAIQRRLLPADTDIGNLAYEDPAELDTHLLPLTPVDQFGVSGLADHRIDPAQWRLTLAGLVAHPRQLRLDPLRQRPPLTRNVLLICPGTFAYHARWQGFALWPLLQEAGLDPQATHVEISGPPEEGPEKARFTLDEIRREQVFLALAVNGQPLPVAHGFPLRVVAEGHVGAEWIKYVDRLEIVHAAVETTPKVRDDGAAFLP